MRNALLAIMAVTVSGFGLTPAFAQSLPVEITVPDACKVESTKPDQWGCEYETPDGRARRILLDFHMITLDEQGREAVQSLSAFRLQLALIREIAKTDERRLEARPEGDYARHIDELLDDKTQPTGFLACAQSLDEMTLKGSNVRTDRAHLHCWAADVVDGVLYQMLLSLLEYNDVDKAASEALAEEFERIVSTIRRK